MRRILSVVVLLIIAASMLAQEAGYIFKPVKDLACTSVKNQNATSTCWCFSGISMLESEMIRLGKKPVDLSVMYIVRQTYEKKTEMYARMHGSSNLAGGGEYGDLLAQSKTSGLVPENLYPGLNYGSAAHNHGELDGAIKGYMDAIIKNSKLSTAWLAGVNGILDAYLGKEPTTFTYEGRQYTPVTFMQEIGIDPDNYICLTSFSHHPFYTSFALEVPDNWAAGLFYNLPLEDMMKVIENSVENGYTVGWASDVSDRGFSMKEGVAIVPEKNWTEMTPDEAAKAFSGPKPEKKISQEMRQKEFDNYGTTDDHGMHIVGTATDQSGTVFYKVKNSWGVTGKYNGYLYVSKPFIALRTTNILVNKKAIPADIAKKMGM